MSIEKTDRVTGAQRVLDNTEHQINEGNHFFLKTFLFDDNGIGSQNIFMFLTPDADSKVRIHAKALIAPDVDYTIIIYEDVVTDDDGTSVPTFNNDRESPNLPLLLAFAEPNIISWGTQMWTARNGGGRNAVGVAPGLNYDIVAKIDTKYAFLLTKNIATDGVVDIDFFWDQLIHRNL